MNLKRKNNFEATVSSSSLGDIMFFLMLFFLIASTLISPSVIKLSLPTSKHHQTVRKTEIAISITKDLHYFLNNKEIPFGQLESEIARAVTGMEDPTVVLRCDNTITVQNLVDILQIGSKLKIKMILATKSPNG